MKALVLFVAVCAAGFTGYHLDLTCCGERAKKGDLPSVTQTKPVPKVAKADTERVEASRDALAQAPR